MPNYPAKLPIVPVISSFSWHIKTATESRQVIVTLMY